MATLYLVGTPIGNLSDITFRAIETLKQVDIIACEDTRVTKKLCNHYDITTPLKSYHEHNKEQQTDYLIQLLKEENNIALVSDAGLPLISDPGYEL
ncbi:MAG: rRNA (cytidine-2'-O-)-methyltransferase, partial [Staphylococcus hominis]